MKLIHIPLIGKVKNLLYPAENGVAEIAYQLGFENSFTFPDYSKKPTGSSFFITLFYRSEFALFEITLTRANAKSNRNSLFFHNQESYMHKCLN